MSPAASCHGSAILWPLTGKLAFAALPEPGWSQTAGGRGRRAAWLQPGKVSLLPAGVPSVKARSELLMLLFRIFHHFQRRLFGSKPRAGGRLGLPTSAAAVEKALRRRSHVTDTAKVSRVSEQRETGQSLRHLHAGAINIPLKAPAFARKRRCGASDFLL